MKLRMPTFTVPIGWRVAGVLAALLALSAWWNVHQWKQAITAPLRAQLAGKDDALDKSAQLLADARALGSELYLSAARSRDALQQATGAYEAAAKQRPLGPQCAPGQARQDAVNRAMGAHTNGATK